jgi:hypothetical protein
MREGFKKLEKERSNYYNIRKVGNYYLSHMEYVQDSLRPSMNIAIPANHEDCYNLQEYMMWPLMYNVMVSHGEEMINNPHIDKNDPLKIHSKSFFILKKDIPSFKKLPINLIPLSINENNENSFYKLTYKIDEMSEYNLQKILNIYSVDLYNENIFEVFNITIEKMKERQQFLKRKFSLFSVNLHRILTIFFNLFRHKYHPDLYGNLQRKYFTFGLIFIFDYDLNDDGHMIYYLKFMCEPKTRSWWRLKHEPGSRYGEYISFQYLVKSYRYRFCTLCRRTKFKEYKCIL